jgi:[acyl-carrier-protein] S-malonyltransferase
MRIGFIFPGQGSQFIGMGKDFYDTFKESKEILDSANDYLGFNLKDLMFSGEENELRLTYNAQPAILTVSVMILRILQKHSITPTIVAGHSLGEFSSLVGADVLDFESAVKLVRKRGQLMDKAAPAGTGGMAAIIGADIEVIEKACEEDDGIVVVANENSPVQVVISGEKDAVERVGNKLKDVAKRVVFLNVSGPFHSPLMKGAQEKLKEAIEETNFNLPGSFVIPNVTAKSTKDIDEIKKNLVKQLTNRVRWVKSMEEMKSQTDLILEVGAGKTLTGLMKKIDRKFPIKTINSVENLNKFLEEFKGA